MFEVAPEPEEQRMLLRVTWPQYVAMRDMLDRRTPRMTYREGVLELLRPSVQHEMWSKNIARVVELYAHILGIDLYGYGSTTFRKEAEDRGCEPDECYVVGKELREIPDIVLEVIHTNPLMDKLDVYAGLGVPEVWVFKNGKFTVHVLDDKERVYRLVEKSAHLPRIDLALVAKHALRRDLPVALRDLEAAIR